MSNTPVIEAVPDVEVVTLPNPDDMVICEWAHVYATGKISADRAIMLPPDRDQNGDLECQIVASWMGMSCQGDVMPICDNGKQDIEGHEKLADIPLICPICRTNCASFRPL